MCRLVFRGDVAVRQARDDFEDADLLKPGDPLDAFPDDHVFGKEETPPLFVIVDVPDMTVEEGRQFCAPMIKELDINGDVDRTKPIALMRSFGADLADLRPTMTRVQLVGVLAQKRPKANPLAIGEGREVIG